MIRIRAPKDFGAGLLFVGLGFAGALIARHYPMGSALRMGPGYFPSVISWCTVLLGAAVLVRSLVIDGASVTRIGWRPLVFVLLAIVLFGVLIAKAGLVVTTIVSAFVGGLAAREMGRIELFLISVGLAIFCSAVFVYGLGQPIALWPF